jgi:D-alanine-D-alanine ligase
MLIGLTYDLRADYLAAGYNEDETAEFDRPDTIDAIQKALTALGHETDRIGHALQLVQRLAAGCRWDLVFNIAEGIHGLGREAQVPAILDAYQIPYTFSDPLALCVCLHKGLTKLVVRQSGVPTPDFAVVEQPEDVHRIDLPLPLFAKPVAEGTGKGVSPTSKVTDRRDLAPVCLGLLEQYRQPVLVETFLPGREFTVGIVGTGSMAHALGTMEILLLPEAEAEVYSYVNKEKCEELVRYRHPQASDDIEVAHAEKIALAAWQALGCRDAGRVDIRSDSLGNPQFLEVNPLAGLHPQHSDLPMICTAAGISYVELIEEILRSAACRLGATDLVSPPAGS